MVTNPFVFASINPILWEWPDKTTQPEVGGLLGNYRNCQQSLNAVPCKSTQRPP